MKRRKFITSSASAAALLPLVNIVGNEANHSYKYNELYQPSASRAATLAFQTTDRFTNDSPLGINVEDIPALNAMPEQKLLETGFIDVTAVPFSADPTGKADATKAIQEAVVFARHHRLAVWFPYGRYLVSDTIQCRVGWSDERTPNHLYLPFCELWPVVLIGERRDGKRPLIRLAPNSPGFIEEAKPIFNFRSRLWNRKTPLAPIPQDASPTGFNALFYGIDIEIGGGNPGAAAIFYSIAEGSTIQDCEFHIGDGFAGVTEGPGGGGAIYNVTIRGGRFGVYNFDPRGRPDNPFVGCHFEGQREVAIRHHGRGNLSMIGCTFVLNPGVTWLRGAYSGGGWSGVKWSPNSLSMIDCVVDYTGVRSEPIIEAETSVMLQNVWIRNATRLIERPNGNLTRTGNMDSWVRVAEAGFPFRATDEPYTHPVYIDTKRVNGDHLVIKAEQEKSAPDLRSRHILWDTTTFPQWNHPDIVNVCNAPYFAKGDGHTDDTEALQGAIERNEKVFIPAGHYRITKTLRLRADSKIIGVSQSYSIIAPMEIEGGDFRDPTKPSPVFETANASEAETQLAFLSVFIPREEVFAAYFIDWKCGGRSSMRCVFPMFGYTDLEFTPFAKNLRPWTNWKWADLIEMSEKTGSVSHFLSSPHPQAMTDRMPDWPMARVHGKGAGGWYPFVALDGRPHGPNRRSIIIENIVGPFHIYKAHLQYIKGTHLEIVNSENIIIYQIKNEYESNAVHATNSRNIRIYCLGGVPWVSSEPKIQLDNCSDVTISTLIWQCRNDPESNLPLIRGMRNNDTEFATEDFEQPIFFSIRPEEGEKTQNQWDK